MAFDFQILRYMPLTVSLMVASVLVALYTQLGEARSNVVPFLISGYYDSALLEIRQGQVWRVLTPILLHFGALHLAFNMLALYFLGQAVEFRQRTSRLAVLVVVTGILSNLAEYIWSGPLFGGMSGVVYGLVGYLWIQARYNPNSGYVINQQVMLFVMVWFVLCWLGLMGNVANMAHTVGLLSGGVAGWFWSPRRRLR